MDYLVINFHLSIIIFESYGGRNLQKVAISFLTLFDEKRPLTGKFSKSVPKWFIATPIDVLNSNFVKFGRREMGKIVPNKKTKFCSALQVVLLLWSSPKSARAYPREFTQSAPDFTKIGSRLAELYPNAWTPSKRVVKCFQYSAELLSLAWSRITSSRHCV